MDRQVRKIRRDTASRALGPLRYEDKGSTGQVVQSAVDAYLSRPRHTHEQYVDLVVDVLPDALSLGEPDQVDVEIVAFLDAPDNARPLLGGGQDLCKPCAVLRGQCCVLAFRSRSVFGIRG